MEIITLTKENLEREHICCAISNNKDCQVSSKKAWLEQRFDDGLVFKKADVRGKCFIEYIPAEKSWVPIEADGYMYINCLWVSGQFKGKGYSNILLEECIRDSKEKGKKGLAVLSSPKKLAFISDPKYMHYKGFLTADTAEPYYELLYLPFEAQAPMPKFKEQAKKPHIDKDGFVLYYSAQCPFTAKYAPIAEEMAKARNIPFTTIKFETAEQAQNAPAASTSYCLFWNGEFVTHEILSEKKLEKIFDEKTTSL